MGELGDERAADDHAGGAVTDGLAGHVEDVLAVEGEQRVRRRPGALGPHPARGPRGRQALAAQGAPDAPGGHGDHDRQDGEQRHADDDGDQHPREPRGVIGVLQGPLLPGRVEHVTEPVHHELQSQEERQRGQDERGGPEIASQAPVEQPRGDETPGQAGIVEALHAGQPRSVFARRGIGGRVGVGTGVPVRIRTVRPPAPVTQCRSAPGASETPSPSSSRATLVVLLRRVGHHHDDLGVGTGGEGGEGGGELRVGAEGFGRAGLPGAAADDQLAADDDDARPLPFGQLLGDVAAGGQRAGGGGRGQEEVAEHHDPAAEGDVDPPHPGRAREPARSPATARCRWSCRPHRLTKEGPRTSFLRRIRVRRGSGACPVGWTFVPGLRSCVAIPAR